MIRFGSIRENEWYIEYVGVWGENLVFQHFNIFLKLQAQKRHNNIGKILFFISNIMCIIIRNKINHL